MQIVESKEISPGRRAFTVDVGNVSNEQIESLMAEMRNRFSATTIHDANTFNPNDATYDLSQYVKDSVRTECRLENLSFDYEKMQQLFALSIHLSELLDAYKKDIFYNKDEKLRKDYDVRLAAIEKIANKLRTAGSYQNKETITNIDSRVFHGILGIMTESGELADIVHKSLLDPLSVIDPIHVQEELGDNNWYQAILYDSLNLNFKQTLTKNTNKLKIRYPEKYSDEHADKRNLTEERKVLES